MSYEPITTHDIQVIGIFCYFSMSCYQLLVCLMDKKIGEQIDCRSFHELALLECTVNFEVFMSLLFFFIRPETKIKLKVIYLFHKNFI